MGRQDLSAALHLLVDVETIHFDDERAVRAALVLHAEGADIADAIHLVAARGNEAFVTFDRGVPSGESIGIEVERL